MLGSDFDCIEDELTLLHQKGYKKSDLNLKQLLLFALYMKKDHKNKGLEGYKLNLFEYANHNLTLGVHKDEIKEICIYNGHDSSIAEMLKKRVKSGGTT